MGKIEAAAKTEPGGLPQVLSEMRQGGRFADLRQQFGNALSDDAGFAAAYDKAAGALAAYGKTRAEIEPILARRPDATAFTQRLTEMDAEIGKAAAATPSKTEGRTMMEDLTKQAVELLQRAVEAVKSTFSRAPSASASSSPSPGG
jgi:ATP phosphoribosyltransferase regulatory subunit HisZ